MPSRFNSGREFSGKKHSESEVQLLRSTSSSSSCTYSGGKSASGSGSSNGDDEGVFCSQSETEVKYVLSSGEPNQQQRSDPQGQPAKVAAFEGYKHFPERSDEVPTGSSISRVSIRSASTVVSDDHACASFPCEVVNGQTMSTTNDEGLYSTPGDPKTMVAKRQYSVLPPGLAPKTTRGTRTAPELPERPPHLVTPRQRQNKTPGGFRTQLSNEFSRIEEGGSPLLNPVSHLWQDSDRSPLPPVPCPHRISGDSIPQCPPPLPPTHQSTTGQNALQPASPSRAKKKLPPLPPSLDYENKYEIPQPSLPSRQSRKNNRHYCLRRRCLLAMTGVSLLIAASSLGILIFFVMTDRNPSTDSDRESCIPCDNLPVTRDNGNMNKLTRKRDPGSGKELCCFDTMNSTQIAALVFVLVDQRQGSVPELKFGSSETPTDSKFVFSPVSAHKQLQPPNGKSNPSSNIFSNMLFNTETDPVKEHLRGVELTKYHLIIKYSGWYFVYSSITFDVDLQKGANCNSFKYKTWKYYIKCQSTGKSGAKTLSSGVTQCCKECSYHSSTSYTGGIFNLKEDDKLSVEVSGSDLVSDQKSSSFLGLAMIGSRGIKQPDSDTEDKKVSKPEKDPE